ncbi:hypothetical protein BpHYR1_014977 [Brachionus plicatilis]|uniref:Uncharacterized protein n=1 Tax=Brachionus plicatilis TaxID=10195 RepID=A0A3M7QS56_BRAPC|nr:hypothetical protein BpHYR1_014977 [Brachionus plicatilis]
MIKKSFITQDYGPMNFLPVHIAISAIHHQTMIIIPQSGNVFYLLKFINHKMVGKLNGQNFGPLKKNLRI